MKKENVKRSNLFSKSRNILIGRNYDALKAAKYKAEKLGYNTLVLSSTIEGETKSVAHIHCEIAKQIRKTVTLCYRKWDGWSKPGVCP